MSKIETSTRKPKVKTGLCVMCGLEVRHVAEVNRHAMCPRCFSDYIEDLVGRRRIRIERNGSRDRNRKESNSRKKHKQTSIGRITELAST